MIGVDVEFGILGPFQVVAADAMLARGGAQRRAVLALLVLAAPEAVSRDRLIDGLWEERPPTSAAHAVEVHISAIRKMLRAAGAEGLLSRSGGGYRLDVEPEQIDARRFDRLVREAQSELGSDSTRAMALFDEALGLWRGEPLEGLEDYEFARVEAQRLREARDLALEGMMETRLAHGESSELVATLAELVSSSPLRERPRRLLMLALYRSGRHAEALDAYRHAAAALDEIGLQPTPELRALEQQILTHDPALTITDPRSRSGSGEQIERTTAEPADGEPRLRRSDVLPTRNGAGAGVVLAQCDGHGSRSGSGSGSERAERVAGRLLTADDAARAAASGTVTMLFTDIEGSTAAARTLGEGWSEVLATHHAILEHAIAEHHGSIQSSDGDGFFAIFATAQDALAAANTAQAALQAHLWPGEALCVRMGIHTGMVQRAATGLVGLEIHRAARIAAAAHGGQIVISEATAVLVRNALPAAVELRDLGSHRLKDLRDPERLFQVVAGGLQATFPPLRSLGNPELPNNLPSYLSSFVGRADDVAGVRRLLEESRLVTIAGPGGAGKTRLALQVAAESLDGTGEGVWFADLSTIADQELVPGAILAALQARPRAGASLEGVLEVLRAERVLVVLDNCEHLLDACAQLAEQILRQCPSVFLLTTSREPLGIAGEAVYRLRPLSVPDPDSDGEALIGASEAVQLFVARTREHDSSFELSDSVAAPVAAICRRLDGMPLALELAAARLSSMSVDDLNDRLGERFQLLTRGSRTAVSRQRTLQATVDWSYQLLDAREREVLAMLSVFSGSFDLAAAEAAGGPRLGAVQIDDAIASLVEKSLVVADRPAGNLRYRLLETIRQYAADRLVDEYGPEVVADLRRAHAEHYVGVVERESGAKVGSRQGSGALRRLDADWENLRAAIEHLDTIQATEPLLRIAVAEVFLGTRAHGEVIPPFLAAIERAGDGMPALVARALACTGSVIAIVRGMFSRSQQQLARELCDRAVTVARRSGDPALLLHCLIDAAIVRLFDDDPAGAEAAVADALALATDQGDQRQLARAKQWLAYSWANGGTADLDLALDLHAEALDGLRRSGEIHELCLALGNHTQLLRLGERGEVELMRQLMDEAAELGEEFGFVWMLPGVWVAQAKGLVDDGDLEPAEMVVRRALRLARRTDQHALADCLELMAMIGLARGEAAWAAEVTGTAQALRTNLREAAGEVSTTQVPADIRRSAAHLQRLESELGAERLGQLLAKGARRSLEEACDLALRRPTKANP